MFAPTNSKRTVKFLLSFFIALVIVSFVFTGTQIGGGTDILAEVDGKSIDSNEFLSAYGQRLSVLAQYFGGNLTPEMIAQFDIGRTVINEMVTGLIAINYANKLGLRASNQEVFDVLKQQLPAELFSNGKLDTEAYTRLLYQQRLNPHQVESDIKNSILANKIQMLISSYALSNDYILNYQTLKNTTVSLKGVTLSKSGLLSYLPVSNKEIDTFINANQVQVQDIFTRDKSQYDQKPEVTASHILVRNTGRTTAEQDELIQKITKELTTANFSDMAKKYSEDEGSKEKGGDLGTFSLGMMVPPFEQTAFSQAVGTISEPVTTDYGKHIIYVRSKKEGKEAKLEDHQKDIAKKLVQESKTEELEKLYQTVIQQLTTELPRKSSPTATKYALTVEDERFSYLDTPAKLSFRDPDLDTLFAGTPKQVFPFTNGDSTTLVYLVSKDVAKRSPEDITTESSELADDTVNRLSEDLMATLRKTSSIITNEEKITRITQQQLQ